MARADQSNFRFNYLSQRPLLQARGTVRESVVMDVRQTGIVRHVQCDELLQRHERTATHVGQIRHTADDEFLKLVKAGERLAVQVDDGVRVHIEVC